MKRIIFACLALMPLAMSAQSDWVKPEETKSQEKTEAPAADKKKKGTDPKYLVGAAPLVDGKVQWTLELDVPNQNAEQIYNRVYQYMEELTKAEDQVKGSQVALVNPKEHSIITTVKEWMIFKKSALSLDRAVASFKLLAFCKDNHLTLTLSRIVFDYTENVPGQEGFYKAEDWIADETALNKKGTKIYPGSSKFRKKMVDRKDQIFNQVKNLWK